MVCVCVCVTQISCTTSTVELVDDLEPLDDVRQLTKTLEISHPIQESDFKTQTRPSSAIHIRLYKTPPPATPTQTKTTPTNPSGPQSSRTSVLQARHTVPTHSHSTDQ